MSKPSTEAKVEPISQKQAAYARTAVRLQVAGAVWDVFDRLRAQGRTQDWLAARLGKSKARVSRLMNGPGNWTMDTLGDLLAAMDARVVDIDVRLNADIDSASPNQDHPWLDAPTRQGGEAAQVSETGEAFRATPAKDP
ncbi:MAG TPA: helix-turn-helix transcriptional regulator [Caulobacteraceae bacterium]